MKKLFKAGSLVATPAVGKLLTLEQFKTLLDRHLSGDWGIVDAEDKATNDKAVKVGNRILSAYPIDPTQECVGYGPNTVWIITEADRSVTTFLLPDEY